MRLYLTLKYPKSLQKYAVLRPTVLNPLELNGKFASSYVDVQSKLMLTSSTDAINSSVCVILTETAELSRCKLCDSSDTGDVIGVEEERHTISAWEAMIGCLSATKIQNLF